MAADPGRAMMVWSPWRRGRRWRRSSPAGGRRGCRSAAPRSVAPPSMRRSSPSMSIRAPEGAQAGGDAGDAVRFLVAQLARAADDGRAATPWRRGKAQDRDLVDRRGDVGRAELDRREARTSGRARSASRLADAVVGARWRPAVVVGAVPRCRRPCARRMSMTARRVGLTPTSRSVSSASGWIAPATSQNAAAETSPGTRSSIALHRHPSLDRPGHRAVRRVRPLDRHAPRPQHPLRVVARRDRLADRRPPIGPQPGQQDRRLDLGARHRRRDVDRPERGMTDHGQWWEGVVPAGVEHGAHRAQWFDDTSHRTATQ